MKRCAIAGGVMLAGSVVPRLAMADSWRVTSGLDYSSGMYGESRETEVVAIPVTAKYVRGPWAVRASLPFLDVDGPANVAIVDEGGGGDGGGDGGGGGVTGVPGSRRQSRSGVGDLTLAATYSVNRIGGSRAYLDLTGKLRLPTGNESEGLGTGATDFIAESELGVAARQGGAYVAVARRFLGDSGRFERVDGWQVSAGGWLSQGRNEIGAWYSWRDASVRTFDDPQEVGAYVSRRINPHWKVQLSASAGLSDASPDLGTAISFTYRNDWRRR